MTDASRRSFAGWLLLALAALAPPAPVGADEPVGPPLQLEVDATAAPRKRLHARLVIPAAPGRLTLLYPKWVPGEHGPTGPAADLAGVRITAGDRKVPWRRDDVDMYALHCEVPEGASAVEVVLDYLLPGAREGFSSAASSTGHLAMINWNQVLLYPRGGNIRATFCRASLKLPAGWKLGTALPIDRTAEQTTTFGRVSLETLIDSPVLCGEHLREVPLGSGEGPPHYLVLAGDSAASVKIPPELKAKYDRLVAEAGALFGTRHYRSYRFLVTLSDHVAHFGLEHHECSDDRVSERMLLDDGPRTLNAELLPHEFVHSWNGKHRRPAEMITDDFQQPQRTRLLWVYEGLTQYLGVVLAARSGLYTPEQCRSRLALIAEWSHNQRGRSWRPLEDTATAAQLLYPARVEGSSWRRGVDFYDEGVLLWLEIDTLIRQKTDGARSLDDFCRRFHGGKGGAPSVKGYALDDVVKELDAVVSHDWKDLLTKRLTATDAPPLAGLQRSGWKLTYGDAPSEIQKVQEAENKTVDLTAALGMLLKEDGTVQDVIAGKSADRAGVAPGMKVVAVNARRWSAQGMRTALAATKTGEAKLQLLIENGDLFQTYALEYRGGEKYARLERDPESKKDVLAEIVKPLTNGKPVGAPE
jgi:predicted metalloprotease with PDZ domain